jgi:hypothetical protein
MFKYYLDNLQFQRVKHHVMKKYEGGGITTCILNLEWLASCPGCFTTGERAPSIHWIGGWAGQPQSWSGHSTNEKT